MNNDKMPVGTSCVVIVCLAVCSWIALGGLIWVLANG